MQLKVFNNLLREKVDFHKKPGEKVQFYSCGPTTYDFLHVGNARAQVVADLMNRVLRTLGYDVTFVRNFTDVDDKIIARAGELGMDPIVFADKWVKECLQDMQALGMKPADATPKVSETMPEIVKMIEDIIANGYAYVVQGEVYFDVSKKNDFGDYGKLSKKDLESLQHGIRVEVDNKKRNSSDFVLWKPTKPNEGASWDSPWGKGRPGWHIECSAMAKKHLGETIDLHHGGVDLMFPHHENEIAQSEAANKKLFCHCWAHNEFLNFGSEKMSKSLGNVVTIRKFVETYGGQVLRHLLLSVHYRAKMEWSDEVIERAMGEVQRIHEFAQEVKSFKADGKPETLTNIIQEMKDELSNDFNSAGAFASFFTFIREVRTLASKNQNSFSRENLVLISETLAFVNEAMGLIHENPQHILEELQKVKRKLGGGTLSDEAIKALIEERKTAKQAKNFKRSDEIRDLLKAQKIVLKDNPDGTTSYSFES
ncbi:MAG: cysteine--tRNA ligase [Bacteriovoracaceae bacterium]